MCVCVCVCVCVCADCIYPDRDTDKRVAGSCEGSNESSGDQIEETSRIAKALPDSQKRLCLMALVGYSRINSTLSDASGAGNLAILR